MSAAYPGGTGAPFDDTPTRDIRPLPGDLAPPRGPGGEHDPGGPADGRSTEEVSCPRCQAPVGVWDQFCEACGHELTPPVVSSGTPGYVAECPVCAADPDAPEGGVTPDGYCEVCGRKVPSDRDHVEVDLGLLAGVSDRGRRHSRNEDAMALATSRSPAGRPVALAVVCDGVSTSPRPDEASLAAARSAVRVLLSAARTGADPQHASVQALHTASARLAEVAGEDGAPACTYASAIVGPDEVTVCWLGDSRVYWLAVAGDDERPAVDVTTQPMATRSGRLASCLLTRDDSLAAELVTNGLMSEDEAMASPQAHVITQWLGADFPDPQAHVAQFKPAGAGALLICSDGLWNYRSEAADLASLALPAGLTAPLDAVTTLVKVANDAGGRDNITAVLVPFPPSTP
ncbi:MAG TPA: PP2C family serine/threonine-protein phosphatase [Trebonia sp.]|nr:PP2C family serine/threonine-protein phosphatase [Trebonia sp.]